MARGRLISKETPVDKTINDLSDDTSRLAFTWLIAFADREGRTYGDPAVVRSMLFPRRDDITIDKMQTYINEWAEQGLVYWYQDDRDTWIAFPNFEKHQPGLRKDREPESVIPPPPSVDIIRQSSGNYPANIPVKLKEVKLKEVNQTSTPKKAKNKPKTPAAVTVFRQQAHRYPAKSWYGDIAERVGEKEPDLERWARIVKEWVGRGWNPTNVSGMLDAYSKGGLNHKETAKEEHFAYTVR